MDNVRLYLGEIDDPNLPRHYGGTTTLFYVEGYYEQENKHLLIEVKDEYIVTVNSRCLVDDIPSKHLPVKYIIKYIQTVIVIKGKIEERIDTDQAYRKHFHNSFEPILVFSKERFKRLIKPVFFPQNWRVYRTDVRYTTSWTNE